MSRPVDPIMEDRNALLDFALAVFGWHQEQNGRSRQRLIDATRVAGTHTGIPDAFAQFARSLEQQPAHGESETR